LPITSGPHSFIIFVDSDLYPVKVDKLRLIFIPALTSPLPATAHLTLNTLTLQLPSNVENEAKAKKGITKLLLFHVCGKPAIIPPLLAIFPILSLPKE
jgi:hypothetical protein